MMAEQNEVLKLIKLAQKGDSNAFGELVESHERFVYNVVYRMLPNNEDARDISQEVFIKAYKYLDKFDGKASFSTWIYRIAVNACIDELRKRKGKETILLDDEFENGEETIKKQYADNAPGVEEQVMTKEGLIFIKKAMDRLSEEHKTIIVLRDLEGLSYTEIAEATQSSLGTVKSRLARARKTLKDIIVREREQTVTSHVK